MKVHWSPTKKQQEALIRNEFEILYGGARGGGKTDAGMAWMLYDIHHPKFRGLIIRKNAKDLSDWIDRARIMYQPTRALFVGAEIRFPMGGKIILGHLNDENAYEQYQGHEYSRMLIEELTQIPTEEMYLKLISSCRSTIKELRPQVFATTNPGGRGHLWVKNRFGLGGDTIKIIETQDKITGRWRIFIPAKVDDNPYIIDNDPTYMSFLEGLPVGLKDAWRYGSWKEIEVRGVYYSKMIAQAEEDDRISQLIYNKGSPVYTVWDLGIGKQLAIGFYQKDGEKIKMIDYWSGEESDGLPQAKKVLDIKPYSYGGHFAPHDVRQTELGTGKTRIEIAEELGIEFQEVPKLSVNNGIEAGQILFCRLYIDRNKCERWLDAMRNYRQEWDEEKGIFKDTPFKDWTNHAADVHRYMAIIEKEMDNSSSDGGFLGRGLGKKNYS